MSRTQTPKQRADAHRRRVIERCMRAIADVCLLGASDRVKLALEVAYDAGIAKGRRQGAANGYC